MADGRFSGLTSTCAKLVNNIPLQLEKLSVTGATLALTADNCELLKTLCIRVKHLVIDPFTAQVELAFSKLVGIGTLELVSPGPGLQMMDDVFCGLHPEEVEDFKWKDEEFLKAVHIVPIRPSIVHVKGEPDLEGNLY